MLSDPEINMIHLLPRMHVWSKFEEDRSRRSRNEKVTDRQTIRPTDMCKPI